jgi:hypothetical protein
MNALGFSLTLPMAALFLVLSSTAGSLGCSSTSSQGGGVGGARAGTGGTDGGTGAGVGGRGGTSDAGADVRGDVRADVSGAGGMIILVDAAGNNFTCAQLQTCCNSITVAALKTACLNGYTTVMPGGDSACGNVLAQIKANGVCP